MTKDEIKKALECCETDWCCVCPYYKYEGCETILKKDVLTLITEQEKENDKLEQLNAIQCDAWQKLSDENERLVTENNSNLRHNAVLRKENKKLKEEIKQAKIDVLNEFKQKYGFYSCYAWSSVVKSLTEIIDEFIKEVENE